jgi:multimeric flavodoxin WrbA
MKVLGIAGSLRAKSNTLQYVDKALSVFRDAGFETTLISLKGKEIKPCNGCYDCVKKGYCTIKGDDFNDILAEMRDAEGLILGSPVYLSSVVPQMMALLARATFVAYWNDKFFSGKVGAPLRWLDGPGTMSPFHSCCSGFSLTASRCPVPLTGMWAWPVRAGQGMRRRMRKG